MNVRYAGLACAALCALAPALTLAQTSSSAYCPRLSISIQRGAHDAATSGQVTELQHFLSTYYSIDPSVIMTGYFGSVTQGNVIKFQQAQNLPAQGFVGLLTRAAIARVCGGNLNTTQNGSGYLSADQTSGGAPLTVTFTTSNVQSIGVGTIDFGDSAVEDDPMCPPTSGKPCTTTTNSHTYTSPGVYTVKLLKYNQPSSLAQTLIASLTITVTGQSASQNRVGNFSASPTSGIAPLAVTFNYSNLDLNDLYTISFGENYSSGNTVTMDCATSSLCTAGSFFHTYNSPGTYMATLNKKNRDFSCVKYPCDPPGATTVSAKVTVGGTPSSSATIDQGSLTPSSSSFYLTGTASAPRFVWVDVINASYTGATDYFSLQSGPCGSGGKQSACGGPTQANEQWSFGVNVNPGTYHVYVFDMSTNLLLATGTFTSN